MQQEMKGDVVGRNNGLDVRFPALAAEWCTQRNGDLTPADVTFGSIRKVWWVCARGHPWRASVNDRTSRPRGCPVCTGKVVLAGFNDLATACPNLVPEWHANKNGDLSPSAVTPGSTTRVWWRCPVCAYDWDAKVCHRALSGTGCPQCAGTVLTPGVNTLDVACPPAATRWATALNGGLPASQVHAGTNKAYYWACGEGHVWKAPVSRVVSVHHHQPPGRDSSTLGCPVCGVARNQHTAPRGTIAQEYPHLIPEWDTDRNDPGVTADTVTSGSDRPIWWRCSRGHSWQARAKSRCTRGGGCPFCSNRRVLAGYNDLATKHPALAACWHPTLNGPLTPRMVTARSSKTVYWLCPHGHTSRGRVSAKTSSSLSADAVLACTECARDRHRAHPDASPSDT